MQNQFDRYQTRRVIEYARAKTPVHRSAVGTWGALLIATVAASSAGYAVASAWDKFAPALYNAVQTIGG